ncbi:SAF domain-containing protein [Agromyces atrinae]|uniref:SAF domain-containing protein n=1 Tax=Agromyces atrinae TaxID=592376 RepID=UPI001F57AD15|nr:SAF domain-containing protein [Agromyces atrinae]MCI2958061.1 SAF domain-containing protein [Agromyces atrinae]
MAGRARSWGLDPRFLIGAALVVASIAGVVGLVASLDDYSTALVAKEHLSPGDEIDEDDLVETPVRLGATAAAYLDDSAFDAGPLVVTRAVAEGELVPLGSVDETHRAADARVVVTVVGTVSRDVAEGAVVDAWSVASGRGSNDESLPPRVLVGGAEVVEIRDDASVVGGGSTLSVELIVPRSDVAAVLAAVAAGDVISLVPAGPGE